MTGPVLSSGASPVFHLSQGFEDLKCETHHFPANLAITRPQLDPLGPKSEVIYQASPSGNRWFHGFPCHRALFVQFQRFTSHCIMTTLDSLPIQLKPLKNKSYKQKKHFWIIFLDFLPVLLLKHNVQILPVTLTNFLQTKLTNMRTKFCPRFKDDIWPIDQATCPFGSTKVQSTNVKPKGSLVNAARQWTWWTPSWLWWVLVMARSWHPLYL